ncbi:HEM4 [Candida metapsilosis]|uniref:HEM4 n=1 Tax=Candida metapsilosis TaxID=273372 RepID=A0A8H8DCX2_9ASCO|nr:HEM4 [Candida metapsilosis]
MSNKTVILLKNPSTPSDPYHDLLLSKSYNPHFIPLLHHEHKDRAQTIAYLTSKQFLEDTSHFIITSQRAVEMLRECIDAISDNDQGSRTISKILAKVGYTVGPATFNILKQVGFDDVRGGIDAGNGSKLADLIMDEVTPETKVVFFTGEVRKDIIPRKLIDVGKFSQFEEFVMYKTCERDDIVDKFNGIVEGDGVSSGWIVFFSPQGTKDIVEYLKRPRNTGEKRWKLASIGPTTKEYLLSHGLTPDTIAAKPNAASLVEGILKCD